MSGIVLKLLLDGLVALLLFLTIIYCRKLNKRIRILQDSKSELASLIEQFDESTERATHSIAEIHEASRRIAENMQHKLDKANFLADDLSFMIEKGSKLADRMEGKIGNRNAAQAQTQNTSGAATLPRSERRPTAPAPRTAARSGRDDKEVLDLAKGGREKAGADEGQAKQKAALESVLERISGRKSSSSSKPAADEEAQPAARTKRPGVRMRTKAEQELMDALKTGNR